ncbi:YecA family protein [Jeotgalibacillus haloalkalitolerans]|uniref:SEC-C domain-containing protein n=1 Tax=Jeotgalibacillus haloalkalitolerans TaxID=3104292 RepID=A0ABU5KK93_9BACL|nr:SEC-C domain-containing protein [Jeotgalibacillus sp. HH7-29]MDZ5711493.1 SEC-C domain-containing protein [Jeotgalibacillus sp. HH7-29]
MQEIGRNEPCPCGSGKKYKKCCANKVVNIETILVKEQMDLQLGFLNEAMAPKQSSFKKDYEYVLQEVQEVFNEPQFLTVFLTYLFGLHGQPSSWEQFLEERTPSVERPRLKELLENWQKPKPVVAEVTEMEELTRKVVMKDLITGETYEVTIPDFHSWAPIDYMFTLLLPFEDKWVPYGFMFPSVYTKSEAAGLKSRVEKLAEDRSEWVSTEGVVEVIRALVGREQAEDNGEWIDQMTASLSSDQQKEALHELKAFWDQRDEDLSLFACHIASAYFAEHGAKVRKPATYLATFSYLMAQHATELPMTQKEAGEAFDVTASSVSSAARKVEEWFVGELEELKKQS